MGLGRRGTPIADDTAWVFNRMADVYDARPAYPLALIDALAALAPKGAWVGDLGAGIGHVAVPLAERGFDVTAVDPARAMLMQLQARARSHGVVVETLHAAAEAVPVEAESFDMVVIADALHFLDCELAGIEVARVLEPGGVLAVVTSDLGDTPFMRSLIALMEEAAPRRPRATDQALSQLVALADVTLTDEQRFTDETPVDQDRLERILRSISFIGPAMNADRFAAFRSRVHALSETMEASWARTFTLRSGLRARRARPTIG